MTVTVTMATCDMSASGSLDRCMHKMLYHRRSIYGLVRWRGAVIPQFPDGPFPLTFFNTDFLGCICNLAPPGRPIFWQFLPVYVVMLRRFRALLRLSLKHFCCPPACLFSVWYIVMSSYAKELPHARNVKEVEFRGVPWVYSPCLKIILLYA